MRVAIVSDIHGNRTALDAVLADLRQTSPDLILHGGDLAHGGSSPAHVVDQIRALGWQGVLGNADEMLFRPESLEKFASESPHLKPLFDSVREMASFTREALGDDRLSWLSRLPRTHILTSFALVHAAPTDTWRSPAAEADEAELNSVYQVLDRPLVFYAHIHRPYIRALAGITIVNTGSVSLSYDGDPRASYVLLDDSKPQIRRIAYDIEREITALHDAASPGAEWTAKMLRSARPAMP